MNQPQPQSKEGKGILKWLLIALVIVVLAAGGEYFYLNYYKQITSAPTSQSNLQTDETTDWQVYTNSDPSYGFTIKYPKEYYLKSLETPLGDLAKDDKETNYETSQTVYLAISDRQGESSESFDIIPGAKIFVTVDIPKKFNIQLDCFDSDSCNYDLDDWVNEMRKDITSLETLEKRNINIGNAKAIVVYSQDKVITKTFRGVYMDVYINQDDLYIALSAQTTQNVDDPRTDVNFKKMLQIIETFRFNQ